MRKLLVFLILSTVISCGKADPHPAYVKILKPPDGAIFHVGDTVEIEARVIVLEKNAGQASYLIIDGRKVEDLDAFPGSPYYWITDGFEAGEHGIEVRVTDGGQETGSDEVTVILKEETTGVNSLNISTGNQFP